MILLKFLVFFGNVSDYIKYVSFAKKLNTERWNTALQKKAFFVNHINLTTLSKLKPHFHVKFSKVNKNLVMLMPQLTVCCIIWQLEVKYCLNSTYTLPLSVTPAFTLAFQTLLSPSTPSRSPLPLSCPLLFNFKSLMFLKCSQDHTNFLSLFPALPLTHTCPLTPPLFSAQKKHPSTCLSLCPPLTTLPSLWSHCSPMTLQSAFILTERKREGRV